MKRGAVRENVENLEQQLKYIHTIRAALLHALGTKTSVHVARFKGRKEILAAEQLRNLQTQVHELTSVLVALVDKVKPYGASYAVYALNSGYTARDEKALQAFWRRISLVDKSILTRERMNADFDATMHGTMKGSLEHILRRHYQDGQHADLYRVVFGNIEPTAPEFVNEDDNGPP